MALSIEKLWADLHREGLTNLDHNAFINDQNQAKMSHIFRSHELENRRNFYLCNESGLGHFIRANVAETALRSSKTLTKKVFFENKINITEELTVKFIKEFDREPYWVKYLDSEKLGRKVIKNIVEFTGAGNGKPYYPEELFYDLASILCGLANTQRSPHDFLYKKFIGKDAILAFKAWFYNGQYPVEKVENSRYFYSNTKDLPFYEKGDKESDDFVENLRKWVLGIPKNETMLTNVYAKYSWTGLESLAKSLYEDEKINQKLRFIYIPVTVRDGARSTFSYGQIIALLLNFVRNEPQNPKVAPIMSTIARTKALVEIRQGLAESPALIVFGGYSERPGNGYQIKRVTRDDLVIPTLIPNLLTPPTIDKARPTSWLKNRIVLLSNENIKRTKTSTDLVSRYRNLDAFRPRCTPLPIIPPTMLPAIREKMGFRHSDDISTFHRKYSGYEEYHNHSTDCCLDFLFSYLKKETKSSQALPAQLAGELTKLSVPFRQEETESPLLYAAITKVLSSLNKNNQVSWLALIFVALTPGGIRLPILKKIMKRFGQSADYLDPVFKDGIKIDDALNGFKDIMNPIICDGRREEHITEPNQFHAKWGGHPKADTLVVAHPSARHGLLECFKRSIDGPKILRDMNLLLCDESIRQYEEGVIKRLTYTDGRISPYRRIIQAIFHGLDAIGQTNLSTALEGGVPESELDDAKLIIPTKWDALWKELYYYYYLEVIERPPQFRLSRFFARNQVKHELLTFFCRPWLLSTHKRSGNRSIIDFLSFEDEGVRQVLSNEISIAHTQVRMMLGLHGELYLNYDNHAAPKVGKYEVREQINRGQYETALEKCDQILLSAVHCHAHPATAKETNSFVTKLHEIMSQASDRCIKIIETGEYNGANINYICHIPDSLADLCKGMNSAQMRLTIDGLNRHGEVWANQADYHRNKIYAKSAANKEKDRLEGEDQRIFLRLASQAFTYFEAAELLRKMAFRIFPDKGHHGISGHATRSAIRTSLVINRFFWNSHLQNNSGDQVLTSPKNTLFAKHAREMLGLLSMHLGHFLNERMYILVLKASMNRLLKYDRDNGDIDLLDDALDYLRQAEQIMMHTSPTSTSRLRFLNERQKCYREIARKLGEGNNKAKNEHLAYATIDVEQMREMSSVLQSSLWNQISNVAELKLNHFSR